jgi:CheY-like chemotaxis protein
MGGDIRVESECGRGSTFTLTARFARPKQGASSFVVPHARLPERTHVLLVDGNAGQATILRGWIESSGAEVSTLPDASSALRTLDLARASGRLPRIVVVDGALPAEARGTLGGWVRKNTSPDRCRLVWLTAGMKLDEELAPGDLQVRKPIAREELGAVLFHAVESSDARPNEPPRRSVRRSIAPNSMPLRVLIAEDNELNADLICELLRRRGHTPQIVGNGNDVLARLEQDSFDVLLLDLHLPGRDGFAVIEAIREHEKATGAHLPVIALTARSRAEDRDRCLAAGMDAFVGKPIRAELLWKTLDELLPARPLHGATEGFGSSEVCPANAVGAVEPPSAPERSPTFDAKSEIDLDTAALLAASGGDFELVVEVRDALQRHVPNELARAAAGLDTGQRLAVAESAHKLKGMMAMTSKAAARLAEELEAAAPEASLHELRSRLASLDDVSRRVLDRLHGLDSESLRRLGIPEASS